MGLLRKIIFLLFIGGYVIVAPLTVLYALGYIFSPAQQTLLQTGLISLSSEPPRATVWLDDTVKDKTPLVLRNLKPGAYDLRLNLEGYHSWHGRIEVKPERALRFENLLLFPLKFEAEVLGDFPVKKIWHSAGGRYLVLLGRETAAGLYLYDLEEKILRPIPLPHPLQEAAVEKIYLHPASNRALFLLKKENVTSRLFVKFTDPVQVADLTDLLKEPLTGLKWSLAHKSSIFYLKDDVLRRVDLESGLFYPVLRKQVQGFALHEGRLYVLEAGGRFLELTEKGKVREILLEDSRKAKLVFGPAPARHYSIFFLPPSPLFFLYENPLAFFLSEEGKLVCNQLPYFLDEGVDKLALAVSHPRLAYRKGRELWVVDFEREREKSFFESGPAARKIHEGEEPIESFTWFYNDQYVLFQEGNRLKIGDFEAQGDTVDLLEISRQVPEFVLDERRGFLYYVHPGDGRLARVKFPTPGVRLTPPLLTEFVDDLVAPSKKTK